MIASRFLHFTFQMNIRYIRRLMLFLGILAFPFLTAYDTHFEGVTDQTLLDLIRSTSQIEKLKDKPPATAIGLRRRVEDDLPNIAQVLHSHAYYNAKIDFEITRENVVWIKIETGPVYPFADFRLIYIEDGKETTEPCEISLKTLGIEIGTPATPEKILDAQDTLLDKLNLAGYAFSEVSKREVLVDQTTHRVTVVLKINKGPLTYFGPVKVSGLDRVRQSFFDNKLRWQRGMRYNPARIEKTQEAIELSGLFRSVNITHGEDPKTAEDLPIKIEVVENKQRTVGLGLNYTTVLGPGLLGEWEDRNISGEGEKLSIRADIWETLQEGRISYRLPDFRGHDQNLIWLAEYTHEKIEAFTERAFSLSAIIERKINEHLRGSYGLMYKLLRSKDSNNNRTFDLIKVPLQLRWSTADSLLNPTKGYIVDFKTIPSLQVLSPQFVYTINNLTASAYYSLTKNDRCIFAAKLQLGSIIGASKHDIPPPERFYAGSENTLRGYKYLTVSPLDHDRKPIGGRSLLIYTLELRFRIGESLGLVPFYEIGNVYATAYPKFSYPQLQTVGLGLSYYTPVGPLRCDVAIPLNRRRHYVGHSRHRHYLDGPFQVYFNIGQSF